MQRWCATFFLVTQTKMHNRFSRFPLENRESQFHHGHCPRLHVLWLILTQIRHNRILSKDAHIYVNLQRVASKAKKNNRWVAITLTEVNLWPKSQPRCPKLKLNSTRDKFKKAICKYNLNRHLTIFPNKVWLIQWNLRILTIDKNLTHENHHFLANYQLGLEVEFLNLR